MTEVHAGERLIAATPERIHRAHTDAQELAAWRAPEGMTAEIEHFDARPGGGYRMALRYDTPGHGKTTDDRDVFEGRFLDVRPDRIEEAVDFQSDDPAFHGTMRMVTVLTPVSGGTRVRIEAHDVPSGISRADHEKGIASSLENLARHVE